MKTYKSPFHVDNEPQDAEVLTLKADLVIAIREGDPEAFPEEVVDLYGLPLEDLLTWATKLHPGLTLTMTVERELCGDVVVFELKLMVGTPTPTTQEHTA